MSKFLTLLALGLAVAGSAHAAGNRYPAAAVTEGVNACASNMSGVSRTTARTFCTCVLDGLQDKFKFGEAIDLLGQVKGSYIPPQLRPIVGTCIIEATTAENAF